MKSIRWLIPVLAVACGKSDGTTVTPPPGTNVVPTPTSTPTSNPPPSDCIEPACKDVPLAPSSHALRLTHAQWEKTVVDLLKLSSPSGLSSSFPSDPSPGGERFGVDIASLIVSNSLWKEYQRAAETLSALAASDSATLDKLLPPAAKTGDVQTRIRAFAEDFLTRAYRRPVTSAELTQALAHVERVALTDTTSDPFLVRARWLIAAALQSPHFLYRLEGGGTEVANGRARLTDYEIASKLSYGIFGTMPDAKLLEAAKGGKLKTRDGVALVAREMLLDARSHASLVAFHERFFETSDYRGVVRQTSTYPSWYPEFGRDAEEDVQRTLEEVLFKRNAGVRELYTTDVAYVNAKLAPLYGINVSSVPALVANPSEFARVQLNGTQRMGILMHAGWLALKGHSKDPATILRGAYVARRTLCIPVGGPPPAAAGVDPSQSTAVTNRKRVEAVTKGCGDGCHGGRGGILNPFGFAFEGFDAMGTQRTKDEEQPIDTSSTTDVLGTFTGPLDFMKTVSTHPSAHACYAAHWSAFLNGVSTVDATPKWLSPIVQKSLGGASVRDLIIELVQTDAFLTVSREGGK